MGSVQLPTYKWKAKYGGLEVSELVRVKELEVEKKSRFSESRIIAILKQAEARTAVPSCAASTA